LEKFPPELAKLVKITEEKHIYPKFPRIFFSKITENSLPNKTLLPIQSGCNPSGPGRPWKLPMLELGAFEQRLLIVQAISKKHCSRLLFFLVYHLA
jgi:hypothetical protein